MYLELKRLNHLRASELPQVAAPFYAVGQLKSARAGYLRIRGFHEAWESCTDRHGPWDGNYRERGFERLCAAVEQGDWVLVLDPSWPPISPAYQQTNGQWEPAHGVWETTVRRRLETQTQTLQQQQREQEILQSRNLPSSAPVVEPAAGPGNRAASLGPHAGVERGDNSIPTVANAASSRKIYTQEQANSCVVASSRNMISQKTGNDIPESTLRDQMKVIMNKPDHDFEKDGINPAYAQELLKRNGVDSEVKTGLTLNDLEAETMKTPVMVGFKNPGHRVILNSVKVNEKGETLFIVDDPAPAYGGSPRAMTESEFSKKYNPNAVVIIPK